MGLQAPSRRCWLHAAAAAPVWGICRSPVHEVQFRFGDDRIREWPDAGEPAAGWCVSGAVAGGKEQHAPSAGVPRESGVQLGRRCPPAPSPRCLAGAAAAIAGLRSRLRGAQRGVPLLLAASIWERCCCAESRVLCSCLCLVNWQKRMPF